MGEVYRARDTRLGRDVAVKVIRAVSSVDADRVARFEHEARAAAALNHPNILAVYDVGQHDGCPYLVTELLDGETLGERLHAGALPVRKALEYAAQIARGLAAAHEKGIVHRDLKPENIVITHDGRAKIVDFGLAKLTDAEPVGGAATMVATVAAITEHDVILGTAGYMAPEQLRGLAVDYRTDIFAFGAVLYEMLCGHSAFRRSTSADTVSAILKEDPTELPPDRRVPSPLQRIVNRCLEKHPAGRFQSTTDLAFALETLFTPSSEGTAVTAPLPRTRVGSARMRTIAAVVLAALSGAIAAGAGVYFSLAPQETPTYRAILPLPPNVTISDSGSPSRRLAISPDGRRLAFTATGPDGKVLLWVRPLDSLVAQPLADTVDAFAPFWSPDSRFIGFFAGAADGKLKKIDASGGPALTICDFSAAPSSASWGRTDVIVFATAGGGAPLFRVSAAGGVPSKATTLDVKAGEGQHWMPFFLPDGQHFLYMSLASGNRAIANYVGSLDSPERKLLVSGGSNAKYAQGYLLFLRTSTLMAQAFDTARLELRGEAVPVAEQVQIGGGSGVTGAYTVSENGVLAYQGGSATGLLTLLTWVDRSGKELGVLGDQAVQADIAVSPDGARASVTIFDPARRSRDIWIYDIARGLRTRFTFGDNESVPVWSPDGSRIVFASSRKGILDLYQKAATGAGGDEVVFADQSAKAPQSWSSDGRFVVYSSGAADMWVLPMFGERKPFPFLQTQFIERQPRFSPDGRWISYVSNESGRFEVYVAPFPGPGGKWQVSTAGGEVPEWKRDGTEIFYLGPDNRLMAAAVDGRTAAFQIGAVRPLFETRVRRAASAGPGLERPYAASPDGRRFLLNNLVERTAMTPITLVVNWQAALKK